MKPFFYYNWQVRHEWFEWAKQLSSEELLKQRVGGLGNILHTLLHVVVVEFDWINDLIGGELIEIQPTDYLSLEAVIELHNQWHPIIKEYVEDWSDECNGKPLVIENGKKIFTYGEVMKHVIVHEIHHIGQLSIWARDMGLLPVQANYIGRGLS